MDLEEEREGRRHRGRVEWGVGKKEWEKKEEKAGRVDMY